MRQRSKMIQYWKMADAKAQRNGPHRSVYWVKRKPVQEDGTVKGEPWMELDRVKDGLRICEDIV